MEEVATLRSDLDRVVRDSVGKFGASEVVALGLEIDDLGIDVDLDAEKQTFLDDFTRLAACKEPKFNCDYITKKIEKEFDSTWSKDVSLKQFFASEIRKMKWSIHVITTRISEPDKIAGLFAEFSEFQFSASKYLSDCESALLSLETNVEMSLEYVKIALFRQAIRRLSTFQVNAVRAQFNLFPIAKRKEIVSIVGNRLVDDLIEKQGPLPKVVSTSPELLSELKRLAKIIEIDFDIESHDGQWFTYLCESKYDRTSETHLIDVDVSPKAQMCGEDPSMAEHINCCFVEGTHVNPEVEKAFAMLMKPDAKYISAVLKRSNYTQAMIRGLTRDKLYAYFRLMFVRNVTLLQAVVDAIREQGKIRDMIDEERKGEDIFATQFLAMRQQIIAVVSKASTEGSNLEALMEMALSMEVTYQEAKLSVVSAISEIMHNTQDKNMSALRLVLSIRPDIQNGHHTSFVAPFELAIDEMKSIGLCLRSLITMQVSRDRDVSFLFGDCLPSCLVHGGGNDYVFCYGATPTSRFEIFSNLSSILNFFDAANQIANELVESIMVVDHQFGGYFRFAVWKQLEVEIEKYFLTTCPIVYQWNAPLSEGVRSLSQCRLLNDISELKDATRNSSVGMSLLSFVELSWKFIMMMIKTDTLIPIYASQQQEFGTSSTIDAFRTLSFAEGDYDFKSVVRDWQPARLNKMMKAQHSFFLILTIASRFNNFKSDAFFVNSFFGINLDSTVFLTKATVTVTERQRVLWRAAELLFYEPDNFAAASYASLFCSIDHLSVPLTDTKRVCGIFIPFAIRTEIAVISCIERCCLKHYETVTLYTMSDGNNGSILDNNDQLSHFFVSRIPESLGLVRSQGVLRTVLEFMALRLQLLLYVRCDSYVALGRTKFLDAFYSHKLWWQPTLFQKMHSELAMSMQATDLEFSVAVFRRECKIIALKQDLSICTLVMDVESGTTPGSSRALKAAWTVINRDINGHPKFMSSCIYVPRYVQQLFYQLDERTRVEVQNQGRRLDRKISESMLPNARDGDMIYKFVQKSYENVFGKLALYQIMNGAKVGTVTRMSSVLGITGDIISGHEKSLVVAIDVSTMPKPQGYSFSELVRVQQVQEKIVENLTEAWMKWKIDVLKEKAAYISGKVNAAFQHPGRQLKPEFHMRKTAKVGAPPLYILAAEAQRQFTEELGFALRKLCFDANDAVIWTGEKQDKHMTISRTDLTDKLAEISAIMTGYETLSRLSLAKMWGGFIRNDFMKRDKNFDVSDAMDLFVRMFVDRYERNILFNLVIRKRPQFLMVAGLRDAEWRFRKEQDRYEKDVTSSTRIEFERLVQDLERETRKCRAQFHRSYTGCFSAALTSIDVFKNDDEAIANVCALPHSPLVIEVPPEPPTEEPVTSHKPAPRKKGGIKGSGSSIADDWNPSQGGKKPKPKRIRVRKVLSGQNSHQHLPAAFSGAVNLSARRSPAQTGGGELNHPKPQKRTMTESSSMLTFVEPATRVPNAIQKPSPRSEQSKPQSEMVDKIHRVNEEIARLRSFARRIRISTTLSGIAVRKMYSRAIAKAAEERKSFSASLWHGKRMFEEEVKEWSGELARGYAGLTKFELERENLLERLTESKKESTQLSHGKELLLNKRLKIEKELQLMGRTTDVNVAALIRKIDAAQYELDLLNEEADEMEYEIQYSIREPMAEADRTRRKIARVVTEQSAANKQREANNEQMKKSRAHAAVVQATRENERLTRINMDLHLKLANYEKQKAEMKPSQVTAMSKVIIPEKRVPRPKTERRAVRKTTVTTRKSRQIFMV